MNKENKEAEMAQFVIESISFLAEIGHSEEDSAKVVLDIYNTWKEISGNGRL